MNELKLFWNSVNKFYFYNLVIITTVLASIIVAFAVQFKVEAMQDKMTQTQAQIAAYKDQMSLLEVEWTYLTRPERLRSLASRYLKDNGYTLASQIKNSDALEKYYIATYEAAEIPMKNENAKLNF